MVAASKNHKHQLRVVGRAVATYPVELILDLSSSLCTSANPIGKANWEGQIRFTAPPRVAVRTTLRLNKVLKRGYKPTLRQTCP